LYVKVWDSFGQYIFTKMKQGKAVTVPKFGTFTFSPVDIDLSVSYTNTYLSILGHNQQGDA